jgi:MoaA/NifB/PqqE/SkfB family radical SAM enzyme
MMGPFQTTALNLGTEVLVRAGPGLAQIGPVRQAIVHRVESAMMDGLKRSRRTGQYPPGVDEERTLMGLALLHTVERAVTDHSLSPAGRRCLFKNLVQTLLVEQGDHAAMAGFNAQHGVDPPFFMTISPSKACNLHCTGCYADSGPQAKKLDWATFDRLVGEAKTLWGARFFAISGGEPLAYRSDGKGVLDLAEKHQDCLFVMFTNGTLIDEGLAARLARLGNLTPALSLEGWRERTDARRGPGVFGKVLAAMQDLRTAGVPYGVSLTATRHNAEEILSDEFVDFCFEHQGALYGFIFQYMPIGRSFTLDLMPTPQQRLWMWRRSWEIIRERQIFLADFWNHGTLSQGCISAGRDNGGGYLYVDWNGAVSPCVFMPYSPVNINDAYAEGKTLNDVWAEPFFAGLREWQRPYRQNKGNWLMPCPMRDHHADLRRLLAEHEPEPTDANAAAALLDAGYVRGLAEYDAAYEAASGPIWDQHYLRPRVDSDGDFRPLPEVGEAGDGAQF